MTTPPAALDFKRLAAEVTARHGFCVKPDDPMMAAATLLQLVLEESAKRFTGELRLALGETAVAAERLQARAGGVLAQEVKEAAAKVRRELQDDIDSASLKTRELVLSIHRAQTRQIMRKWFAAGVICGMLLFAGGFVLGWFLRCR